MLHGTATAAPAASMASYNPLGYDEEAGGGLLSGRHKRSLAPSFEFGETAVRQVGGSRQPLVAWCRAEGPRRAVAPVCAPLHAHDQLVLQGLQGPQHAQAQAQRMHARTRTRMATRAARTNEPARTRWASRTRTRMHALGFMLAHIRTRRASSARCLAC